jgi:Ca2+-transporting ATPase
MILAASHYSSLMCPLHSTLVFNIFVWCQIFNMINCRQLGSSFNVSTGLYKNFWILGILAISACNRYEPRKALTRMFTVIGGQILIVFFGGAAFDTTPISPTYWALSIGFGAGSLVVGALVRLIPDAPIGQLLIKLRIMPDLDTLPRTRPSKRGSDADSGDLHGKPFKCVCLSTRCRTT